MNQLLAKIQNNVVVLTPNRRLTNYLHAQYNQLQLAKHRSCWPTPTIQPLNNWLEEIWRNNSMTEILLSDLAENILWARAITRTTNSQTNAQLSQPIINAAKEAYNILQHWQITPSHLAIDPNPNTLAFRDWLNTFIELQRDNNICTKTTALTTLPAQIKNKKINLPEHIVLVGFEQWSLSPLLQTLFTAMNIHGCSVEFIDINTTDGQPQQVALNDVKHEITTMARWASQCLANNPDALIGCVVANLALQRNKIAAIFTEVFTAAKPTQTSVDPDDLPFNISIGKSLDSQPLINIIFNILALNDQALQRKDILEVLASPFVVFDDIDTTERAVLNAKLRDIQYQQYIGKNILEKISIKSNSCKNLLQKLISLQIKNPASDTNYFPSYWARKFIEQLSLFGWPGKKSLTNDELQTIKRWQKLITEFSQLDYILPKISQPEALAYLKIYAASTIFQPQTNVKPINILGTLEAAGINFDHLWIMGMDETTWPATPQPNPFIPRILQQQLKLPHSSTSRELEVATALLTRFNKSCPKVIYSYATQRDDLSLKPSKLLAHLPILTQDELTTTLASFISRKKLIFNSRQNYRETTNESFLHPLQLNEKTTLRGGSDLLKTQALCPFQAFAKYRLLLQPKIANNIIFVRGKIVHRALELIWQHLGDHQTLTTKPHQALLSLVTKCTHIALREIKQLSFPEINKIYLQLEQHCLTKLLMQWLEFEKTRTPFTVLALENTMQTQLGQLTLTLRVDRIDKLQNDNLIIIDYKTNRNAQSAPLPTAWLDSIAEPQLPLYCITSANAIDGLFFAYLRNNAKYPVLGKSRIAGAIQQNSTADFVEPTTWDELINMWQTSLEKLANDFYHGIAAAQPARTDTCSNCSFSALCRKYDA